MKIKLTDEEKENMSYTDIAYLILKETKKKYKIQDLFMKVIKLLDGTEQDFENNIGNFFELVITDKRFIMLDGGYCDLKINHSSKVVVEEDDDDYEIISEEEDIDEEAEEDNYDEDANADDDSEDELQDLVIIDDSEDLDSSEM